MNNIRTIESMYSMYLNYLSTEQDKLYFDTVNLYNLCQGGENFNKVAPTRTNSDENVITENIENRDSINNLKSLFSIESKENINEKTVNIKSVENCSNKEKKVKNDKKVFKCSFDNCEKIFNYKWILDRHLNSHFSFRLFKCESENCGKAYKSKENLNLHVKNKHMNQKPYKCSFCDLKFSHRNGKFLL